MSRRRTGERSPRTPAAGWRGLDDAARSPADSGGRLPPAGLPTPICSFRSRLPGRPWSRRRRPRRSARPAGFGANAWRSRCGQGRSTASGAARPRTSALPRREGQSASGLPAVRRSWARRPVVPRLARMRRRTGSWSPGAGRAAISRRWPVPPAARGGGRADMRLDGLAKREVAWQDDVAERDDEGALYGPRANSRNGGELGHHLLVRQAAQRVRVQPTVRQPLSQVPERADFPP